MTRPVKSPMGRRDRVTVWVPSTLLDLLRARADCLGVSLSDVVTGGLVRGYPEMQREALEQALAEDGE